MTRLRSLLRVLPTARFDGLLAIVLLLGLAIARAGRFEERDPYWGIRAGLENLAGEPLARPDAWSWSMPGQVWYQNSPLWNSILGIGFPVAGFGWMFAVTLALLAGYLLTAWRLSLRLGARALPGWLGLMLAVTGGYAMLSPRATLAVQLIVLAAVWFALEWSQRCAGSWRAAPAAATIFGVAAVASVFGNWIHLSFLAMAPVVAGMWSIVWLFLPRSWGFRIALIAASAFGWALGPLLSPYGLAGGVARTIAVQQACQGLILEWSSPFSGSVQLAILGVLVPLISIVVGGWVIRRALAGPRDLRLGAILALSALGVPAGLAGLFTARFLGIGILTLAPVVAAATTALVDRLRRAGAGHSGRRWWQYTTGGFWRVSLWIVAVILLPGSLLLGSQLARPAELAMMAQLPSGCRFYGDAGTGSVVVLSRPDVPVWMDGRADFFGREMLLRGYQYYFGKAPDIVPPGTTCVLLDVADRATRLVADNVASSPQWREAGRAGSWVLWLPAG